MPSAQTGVIYEVGLKIKTEQAGGIELLKGLLIDVGFCLNDVAESETFPHTVLTVYTKSRKKAQALRSKLKAWHLNDVLIEIRTLKKQDWQTKWKKGFKPFRLTNSFDVVPERYRKTYRKRGRKPLYIDTDMAFGTGLHPTTRFMAQLVEQYAHRCETFLDIGTGTGILSMIAHKSGVPSVKAFDVSADAVKVAKNNFIANQCSGITLEKRDAHSMKSKQRYDFICANIITQDLIQLAKKLVPIMGKGKYLALSGISVNSYPELRKAYARYPLRCLNIKRGEGWVAILFKRI